MKPVLQGIDIFARKKGWLRWHKSRARKLTCPACRENTSMTSRLDTASPAHRFHRFALYECPACGTGHFPDLKPPAYEGKKTKDGEGIRETAALKYYLEQGAGQLSMIEPFLPLADGSKKSLLEIGCGYGLGLHFAHEALHWDVSGCDPSSLARVGAKELNIPVLPIYLDENTALQTEPVDVVYSSEVIEHVADPDGFLAPLRQSLKSDGVLVLTTPDIAGIKMGRELDSMIPLVSPGSHIVLFSKTGLQKTLRRSGFKHVKVHCNGDTLIAYGSNKPLNLQNNTSDGLALYSKYLNKQITDFKGHNQLFTGFCGRLIKEQVNAAQYQKAAKSLEKLTTHWRSVFNIDLNRPDQLVFPDPEAMSFEKFANLIPFNICSTLYHSGVLALNHGKDMDKALKFFESCRHSADILHKALHKVNVVDMENRLLSGLADALAIGLSANDKPELAAKRLRIAQESPIHDQCKAAYFNAELDVFSAAANTGKWETARPFADNIAQALQRDGIKSERERSAATGLAMLALNDDFDRKSGIFWLQMALSDAPKKPPWTALRAVWGDHAAARGAELLAKGGQQELAKDIEQIRAGLLARPAKKTDASVLIALARLHKDTDNGKCLQLLKRALRVTSGKTAVDLKQQITDTEIQIFLQAVNDRDVNTIGKFREQMEDVAKGNQTPQSLLFALGIDYLNRMKDPVTASKWLKLANEGSDEELRQEASNALKIARQQIRDQLVDASNRGKYSKIGKLQKSIDPDNKDPQVLYALAMYYLNHKNQPELAVEKFAQAAQLTRDDKLRDQALFHQSLSLARSGKSAQAKQVANRLFDDENRTITSILSSRRNELDAEIRGKIRT